MTVQTKLCLLLVLFSPLLTDAGLGHMKLRFGWKVLQFKYPNEAARQEAITSGKYVPGNSQPIYALHADHRVFLTVPRLKEGVPATLASVPSNPPECHHGKLCSPRLQPFPDWDWNNGNKGCDGLTSVFVVNVDKCGHLWVLDSGVENLLSSNKNAPCPPQLLSFDLSNNQLIRRYTFPNNVLKCNSLLVTIVLDTVSTANGCRNTFAYSADLAGFGLIVTDTKRGNSWRVENKLFFPYPKWGTFNIGGEIFDLMFGLVSMAVHPHRNPETRRLYFHSLASATESYVPVSLLHNASEVNVRMADFITLKGEKPTQAATSAFDSRGILFFGLLGRNSLACWNPSRSHKPSNIIDVAQDDEALQFSTCVNVSYVICLLFLVLVIFLNILKWHVLGTKDVVVQLQLFNTIS